MPARKKSPNARGFKRARAFILLILVPLALCLGFGAVSVEMNWVPDIVDFMRGLPFVGPDRVAAMENAVYNAQDAWNQFLYTRTHPPVVIADVEQEHLNSTPTAPSATPATPVPALSPTIVAPVQVSGTVRTPNPTPVPLPTTIPTPPRLLPLIISDPQPGEGEWISGDMPLGNSKNPPLWHTFYRPDPTRPYARVDLVWIDLSQTQLTMVPGITEPRAVDGTRGAGVIPPAVQSGGKLLASWNGGFLTINGAYGMMVDRRMILPPRDGFATLAQYEDGSMRLGVWGRDITLSPDLVTFRENGPILIDHGILNQDGLLAWGKSVSGETHIWRSGIGFTADGALIYAAGNSLSAQTLGAAMLRAGVVEAMQLDVNAWHVYFFTYTLGDKGSVPTKLDPTMPGPLRMYLTPYDRDFMYLTLE